MKAKATATLIVLAVTPIFMAAEESDVSPLKVYVFGAQERKYEEDERRALYAQLKAEALRLGKAKDALKKKYKSQHGKKLKLWPEDAVSERPWREKCLYKAFGSGDCPATRVVQTGASLNYCISYSYLGEVWSVPL